MAKDKDKGPAVAPFFPANNASNHRLSASYNSLLLILTYFKENQPTFITMVVDQLQNSGLFTEAPFQISVNVYDSPDYWIIVSRLIEFSILIMLLNAFIVSYGKPHKDGSGSHVAILSFQSHTILDFYHRPLKPGQAIIHTEVTISVG